MKSKEAFIAQRGGRGVEGQKKNLCFEKCLDEVNCFVQMRTELSIIILYPFVISGCAAIMKN